MKVFCYSLRKGWGTEFCQLTYPVAENYQLVLVLVAAAEAVSLFARSAAAVAPTHPHTPPAPADAAPVAAEPVPGTVPRVLLTALQIPPAAAAAAVGAVCAGCTKRAGLLICERGGWHA